MVGDRVNRSNVAVDGRVASEKPPLVLLHPFLLSGNAWHGVIPYLSGHHHVFAPTLLGHRGGPPVQRRPATITDVIDMAECFLDEGRLARPHLVGNPTGGYVAIELARRGRATTVCALSSAGFWSVGEVSETRAAKRVRRIAAMSRISRPVAPVVFRSALVRRLSFRRLDVARPADRLSAARAVESLGDIVACTVDAKEVHGADQIAPLDPLPCPITLAWSEKDSLFPVATYGKVARERLPKATFKILRDVGHEPTVDDPELVARTILEVTGVRMSQR